MPRTMALFRARLASGDIRPVMWQIGVMPALFLLIAALCLAFPREAATVWLLLWGWLHWLRSR